MTYGVCGSPEITAIAADAGFDYFEWTVPSLLQPRGDSTAFQKALDAVHAAALPCPVCNCFLPGDLKITGPAIDKDAIEAYVTTACERAAIAKVDTIVFGSGGARQIPEGFDRSEAEDQLLHFLKMLGPIAAQHKVTVVIEPLRYEECNVFNTVAECARFTKMAAHPGIQLLVDGYHWACNGEPESDIIEAAPLFCHMHVATQANRRTPGAEPCDAFPRFMKTVRQIGYQGRMSIEGRIDDPETELPVAMKLFKEG